MSTNSSLARFLRFIGILLMGLTAGFTLLGGAGTSCVAFKPLGFGESMAKLAPFQWLYIVFVLVGIVLGALGIRATILLIKGRDKSYREALLVLIAGVVAGVVHLATSRALRGSSMPVDAVVYTTILTLLVFLLFRIPSIWQGVDFSRGDAKSNMPAGGAAAIALGLLALTIEYTMGPTHTWSNVNYADAFRVSMTGMGGFCLLLGCALLLAPVVGRLAGSLPAPASSSARR